jgi:hypothetical protein
MGGWMDGWMDGLTDGRVDGWMDWLIDWLFIVGVCILLRVYQITRQNPSSQQINKRALFRALYDHNMFRPSQKAIFRWLLV